MKFPKKQILDGIYVIIFRWCCNDYLSLRNLPQKFTGTPVCYQFAMSRLIEASFYRAGRFQMWFLLQARKFYLTHSRLK